MNSIALACTGVLGLLLFVLGLTITIVRSRVGLLSGYAPEPDRLLTKLVRAHGNTAEYAPFFAVIGGLPGVPLPLMRVQWSRNRLRCHAITVAG
ncbi:MAPEG family protein [Paraburkholderia sp. BL10I2N1]|nr:MAPEG family protein [Paraburkholderia sp. BL10I2N1]